MLFPIHYFKKVQSLPFFHFQKLERFFQNLEKITIKSSENGCNQRPERPAERVFLCVLSALHPFRGEKTLAKRVELF